RDVALAALGAAGRSLRAGVDRGPGDDGGDAPPPRAREPRGSRPAAAALRAALLASDAAGAHRGGQIASVSHSHSHTSARRPVAIALALILGLMAGEVVFGFAAGSLALLADAGHMLSDAVALGLALAAATYATRPPRGRWTFGFRRLEILAAHAN